MSSWELEPTDTVPGYYAFVNVYTSQDTDARWGTIAAAIRDVQVTHDRDRAWAGDPAPGGRGLVDGAPRARPTQGADQGPTGRYPHRP